MSFVKAFESIPHHMLFEMLETEYVVTEGYDIYSYLYALYALVSVYIFRDF